MSEKFTQFASEITGKSPAQAEALAFEEMAKLTHLGDMTPKQKRLSPSFASESDYDHNLNLFVHCLQNPAIYHGVMEPSLPERQRKMIESAVKSLAKS